MEGENFPFFLFLPSITFIVFIEWVIFHINDFHYYVVYFMHAPQRVDGVSIIYINYSMYRRFSIDEGFLPHFTYFLHSFDCFLMITFITLIVITTINITSYFFFWLKQFSPCLWLPFLGENPFFAHHDESFDLWIWSDFQDEIFIHKFLKRFSVFMSDTWWIWELSCGFLFKEIWRWLGWLFEWGEIYCASFS